jgi:hypothetical protein
MYGGTASPNPDYKQDIHTVTGDCEVDVVNKNLFDKNNVIDGYRLGGDGTNYPNPGYSVTDFIKVKPSTNFYRNRAINIMEAVCLYDKDKNFISRLLNGNAFTTTENTYYIKTDVENTYLNTTQLELGSTASPYTPHAHQTFPLSLGDIELYADDEIEIDFVQKSGYKKVTGARFVKNWKGAILNGNQSIINQQTYGNNVRFGIIPSNTYTNEIYYDGIKTINCMCNAMQISYLKTISGDSASATTTPALYCHSSAIFVTMPESYNVSTGEEMSEWLSTHNLKVVYKLATPITTEITDPTLLAQLETLINMKTYKNITNIITTGDDLAPIASIVYKKDLTILLNQ